MVADKKAKVFKLEISRQGVKKASRDKKLKDI